MGLDLQLGGRRQDGTEFSHDAIIAKTLEGIVMSWNPGAEKMYAWAPVR